MIINNYYRVILILILISSIGVYVIPSIGVRTDTIVLYLSLIIVLFLMFKQKKIIINDPLFLLLFTVITFTPIIITFIGHGTFNLKFIAGAESLLSSLTVIFIFCLIRFWHINDFLKFFKILSLIYFIILTISTILAILSLSIELNRIGVLLWGSEGAVGFLAQSNFRYTGVFNLPIEAGIANTLGVFNLYYARKYKFINENILVIFVITITIGGILSISKVFLLIGLPLLILILLLSFRFKYFVNSILIFIVAYFSVRFFLSDWMGIRFIENAFNNIFYGDNMLRGLTSGRFGGGDSQQSQFISEILSTYPLIGNGLGNLDVYDSTITFILSSGGLIYLLVFIISMILFLIVYKSYIIPREDETLMIFFYLIFLFVISIGTPVLWLNKVNLYLWLFLLLIFRLVRYRANTKGGEILPNEKIDGV